MQMVRSGDNGKTQPLSQIDQFFFQCSMCQRVLLMVLWLLIGTRLRLLAVGILSTTEPLCPSRRLFGTIL